MKQYISKLILSFSVVALLFNCETEELNETNNSVAETPPKSTIHKVAHDKIIKNKTLSKQLSTLTKAIETHNKQHKTVYSSAYNFYINTDYATYIENPDGEGHTYTFSIQRDTETPVLENLVLSSTANNSYTMHLVTYNITAQEKELLAQGDIIDLNNKVSSVTLDDAGLLSGIFNKETTITCLEIAISYCKYNNGAHSEGYEENGSQCPGYAEQVIATVGDCDNSSNGNSTGNTDTTSDTTNDPTNTTNNNNDTSTNTTTSNGGSSSTPVTSPTLCPDCPEISEDDCPEVNPDSLTEAEAVFGTGNVIFDCSLNSNNTLHFNSAQEANEFIESFSNMPAVDGEFIDNDEGDPKIDRRYFTISQGVANCRLKVTVLYEDPASQDECMNVISVVPQLIGNTTFHTWTSTFPTIVTDDGEVVTMVTEGIVKINVDADGLPLAVSITKSVTVTMKYDYSTSTYMGGNIIIVSQ